MAYWQFEDTVALDESGASKLRLVAKDSSANGKSCFPISCELSGNHHSRNAKCNLSAIVLTAGNHLPLVNPPVAADVVIQNEVFFFKNGRHALPFALSCRPLQKLPQQACSSKCGVVQTFYRCWKYPAYVLQSDGQHKLQTSALSFRNNYAINHNVSGMPTADFTLAFWARTPAIDDDRAPGANQAELFSYATHLKESGESCSDRHSYILQRNANLQQYEHGHARQPSAAHDDLQICNCRQQGAPDLCGRRHSD